MAVVEIVAKEEEIMVERGKGGHLILLFQQGDNLILLSLLCVQMAFKEGEISSIVCGDIVRRCSSAQHFSV